MKRLLIIIFLLIATSIPALCGQRYIRFDAQAGGWTATNALAGVDSGVAAVIKDEKDNGTSGILELVQISDINALQDNEVIYESALGGELLTNTSLEVGGTGDDFDSGAEVDDGTSDTWTDWRKAIHDATHRAESTATNNSGNYAIKFVSESSPGEVKIDNYDTGTPVATVGGEYVLFSGYFRSDGVSGAYVITFAYDRTHASYPFSGSDLEVGTDYTKATHAWFVQAGCVDLEIGFRLANQVGTVYIDDISLKQITNAALVNGTVYGGGRSSW